MIIPNKTSGGNQAVIEAGNWVRYLKWWGRGKPPQSYVMLRTTCKKEGSSKKDRKRTKQNTTMMILPTLWVQLFKISLYKGITLQILEAPPRCLDDREEGRGRECLALHLGHQCFMKITHLLSSISLPFIHVQPTAPPPFSREAGVLAGPPLSSFCLQPSMLGFTCLPTHFLPISWNPNSAYPVGSISSHFCQHSLAELFNYHISSLPDTPVGLLSSAF